MTPSIFEVDTVTIPVDAHIGEVLQIELGFIAGIHFGANIFSRAGICRSADGGKSDYATSTVL
jgi:hypothetical protein